VQLLFLAIKSHPRGSASIRFHIFVSLNVIYLSFFPQACIVAVLALGDGRFLTSKLPSQSVIIHYGIVNVQLYSSAGISERSGRSLFTRCKVRLL